MMGGAIIWDFEPERLAMQQMGLMGMQPEQHTAIKRLVMPPFPSQFDEVAE